jgi:hypothetical protein
VKTELKLTEKSDKYLMSLAIKICESLNGLTMWQALWIVEKQVPMLLREGHFVDVANSRFTVLKRHLVSQFSEPRQSGT